MHLCTINVIAVPLMFITFVASENAY